MTTLIDVDLVPGDDYDLIRRAGSGDGDAFMTLYVRYQAYVRSRAYAETYPQERETIVDDITQDTWLRLLCGKWRPSQDVTRRDLRPFLQTLVRYVTYRCRQDARVVGQCKVAVELDADLKRLLRLLPAPTVDLDQQLLDEQRLRKIRLALGILTPLQRRALYLRYAENLATRDIAARLGLSATQQSASAILCKARRRICAFVGVEYLSGSERIIPLARAPKAERSLAKTNYNRKRRRDRARARREAAA